MAIACECFFWYYFYMTNYEARPHNEDQPNPDAGKYRARFAELVEGKSYRDPSDALFEMAQPLLEAPQRDKWTEIATIGHYDNEVQNRKVPFTEKELEVIIPVSLVHDKLLYEAGEGSNPAREYSYGSMFFPTEATQLSTRDISVWGIMTSALTAERMMTIYKDTAWEPQGEELEWLTTVRDLPDKLAAIRAENAEDYSDD
jgi:hypothetical protein